jgi:hypothetical protein
MPSAGHHVYRLIVAIAYIDPPRAPLASNPLYADLNLAIVGPDGPVLFGNGIQDEFSTLETVVVDAASGVYELHVIAATFPDQLLYRRPRIVRSFRFH